MRCINRRSMIAACLFYACKIHGETRSPKEIAEIYDLDIKNVNRGTRKFEQLVNINKLMFEYKSSQSSDFIERNALKLNMAENYIKIAINITIFSVLGGVIAYFLGYFLWNIISPTLSEYYPGFIFKLSPFKMYLYFFIGTCTSLPSLARSGGDPIWSLT